MLQMMILALDVAKIYSPSRIAEMTNTIGLKVGRGIDITTYNDDDGAWDSHVPGMRKRAARRTLTDKSLWWFGRPICIIYRVMNQANHVKMTSEIIETRFAYVKKHIKCYKIIDITSLGEDDSSYMDVWKAFRHGKGHVLTKCYDLRKLWKWWGINVAMD